MSPRQRIGFVAGPLLAILAAALAGHAGLGSDAAWTAAITALCATWWISEALPIPATSLIPFVAFPMTGVLDHGTVAGAYGHTLILLLLGGFILSTAMEKNGAHRRIALGLVHAVGGDGGRRMVLAFMLASGLLSMWISNTATVLMLFPVALAILESDRDGRLSVPLLLGLAYAASIGGLGTPIGTPPNVIFMGVYSEFTGHEPSFLQWMSVGVPVAAVLILVAWFWLTRGLVSNGEIRVPHPGQWTSAEKRVLVVFSCAALAWMTRTAPFGGWSALLGVEGHVGDATVALAAVLACFLIPDGRSGRLLDWKTAERIPWGLLILFGGGIAIAKGFEASGLSAALGEGLAEWTHWPPILLALAICLTVTFMTETTSNTATATLMMPVLAATALAAGLEPAWLMIPAAMSASCAFMLPVATAPNAVVFGSGRVPIQRMAAEGLMLNFLGAAVIATASVVWLPKVFG
jgi:sodium-dependent dicarboxylate transporter 2/3/5